MSVAVEAPLLEFFSFRNFGQYEIYPAPGWQPVAPALQTATPDALAQACLAGDSTATECASAIAAFDPAADEPRAFFERERARLTSALGWLTALDAQLLNAQASTPGQAVPGLYEQRSELTRIIAKVEGTLVTLEEFGGSYDLVNDLKAEAQPNTSKATAMSATPWGGQTQTPAEPARVWEVDGKVGWNSGTATYAESESAEFELSETLKTRSGKKYEFYQSYGIDHSYVNSSELVIGGEQEFPELLWRGDLELTEEFTQYKDKNDPLNDRQDGLFKLGFSPEWLDGTFKADFDYKYNIKEYETFSVRSYKYHSGKAQLTWKAAEELTGKGWTAFDDYNYSLGSNRSSNRVNYGTSWDWQVRDDLELSAEAEQETKSYDITKSRNYDQVSYEGQTRWQPDERSSLTVSGGFTDYLRDYDPEESYEDTNFEASYQRDLTERLDLSLRYSDRDKHFNLDPMSDSGTKGASGSLNYNPTERWNFRLDANREDVTYANTARSYLATGSTFGASYSAGGFNASGSWRRSENAYDEEPDQDYTQDSYDFDLGYGFGAHDVRVYYGVAYLDQADPASTNDYTEKRYGAEWQFSLDPGADLRVSYDFNERAYDARDTTEDSSFAASLSFKF